MVLELPNPFSPSRLSLARRRRGYSREELAFVVEVSLAEVRAWERGDAEPTPDVVDRLVDALRFPRQWFYMEPAQRLRWESTSLQVLSLTWLTRRAARLRALRPLIAAAVAAADASPWQVSPQVDALKRAVYDLRTRGAIPWPPA